MKRQLLMMAGKEALMRELKIDDTRDVKPIMMDLSQGGYTNV